MVSVGSQRWLAAGIEGASTRHPIGTIARAGCAKVRACICLFHKDERLAALEHGMWRAVAHVLGGGVYGDAWHRAGMREFGSTLKPVRRLKFRGIYRARSRWFHPSALPWMWQNESRQR